MPELKMQNKTFRLFISSPFCDFRAEREVLQTKVFPIIEKYCVEQGYQFQPVDLRWGINEEAQLDQKTLEICLNEVRVCKHYPHPNFLIMQGDRYGWIPLPYAIEKKEFEQILKYYSGNTGKMGILTKWYKHDLNHVILNDSTAYVLQQRTDEYKEPTNWQEVENELRNLLQRAVKNIHLDAKEKNKYFLSATEQEVIEGIFRYLDPTEYQIELQSENVDLPALDEKYVYGFVRHIRDGAIHATDPIFLGDNFEKSIKFKSNLVNTLSKNNILQLETNLIAEGQLYDNYLDIFADRFLKYLKKSIKTQIEDIKQVDMLEQEKKEHEMFMLSRTKVFVGRMDVLAKIETYLKNNSTTPFVIYGKSGMGKTAVMAKTVFNAIKSDSENIIFRFVGASDKSSTIRSLLLSIINEIDSSKMEELTGIYDEGKFETQVREILSGVKNRTIIFIDALDQLRRKNHLRWLPKKLPVNLKLVISVLDDENYKEDSDYLNILKVIYQNNTSRDNFISLAPLNSANGLQILNQSLFKINRKLTNRQKEYILKKFEQAGYSPLYLIIAIEVVKNWQSFDKYLDGRLADNVENLVKEFIQNLSVVYHHQKILVNRTLAYIECSKNGLSEKEILDILSKDEEIVSGLENVYHRNRSSKIPIAPWARLYYQLSPFLIKKSSDDVSLITFFHRQFDRVIHESIINDETLRNKLHLQMAAYYKQQPLDYGDGVYNLRKLTEYFYQLYQGKQIDEMLDLCDQNYIKIKYDLGLDRLNWNLTKCHDENLILP